MSDSQKIYEAFMKVMESIEEDYKKSKCNFFVERDLVWTVQQLLQDALDGKKDGDKYYGKKYAVNENITEDKDKYIVYNDYPICESTNRSICVDLAVVKQKIYKEKGYRAIRDGTEEAELVVEFKFEPKERRGIQSHKSDVVAWNDVKIDINRVKCFVDKGKAKIAIAILVDEGGIHKNRNGNDIVEPSTWKPPYRSDNDIEIISILWTEFTKNSNDPPKFCNRKYHAEKCFEQTMKG